MLPRTSTAAQLVWACMQTYSGMNIKLKMRWKIDNQCNCTVLTQTSQTNLRRRKRVAFLEEELKMLKRGFGIFEKRLEKSKMLIAEYRKFKAKNVKHFRFKLDNNSGTFGEIRYFLFAYSIFKFRKRTATFNPPIGGDLLYHAHL